MSELPQGWETARVEELTTKVGSGATPKGGEAAYKSTGTPLIRSMNVVFFGFKRQGLASLDDEQAAALKGVEVRANDVLLNITGASIGRATLAPVDMDGARVNQHVCIIRPKGAIDARYLGAYLSCPTMQAEITAENYGVTRQALTKQQILDFEIPLPPLPEQKRIADKLDALLARVDACRERLERVPDILKRFRQSVLAAATSGELTREWREEQGLTRAAWRQTTFEAICSEITVGFVGKMADQYRPEGVPFLRSQNVRPFKFDPRELRYVSPQFHRSIAKSTLRPGDVVVVRTGAPGQCCVIPRELKEANCSDLVIVRPGPELESDFAVVFINSETSQSFVKSEQVGVAQSHFNVGSMKRSPIELPSVVEQREIARRVRTLFDLAMQLEERTSKARGVTDTLTPAALAKAFRGELVPQDPNDEPASRVLARLRTRPASTGNTAKAEAGRRARSFSVLAQGSRSHRE